MIVCRIESSQKQHLFEIESFCNIMNIVTVTLDQFNASLLNKNMNFLKKKTQSPNLQTCSSKILIMRSIDNYNNVSRSSDRHIRGISEGSCDTVDWSDDDADASQE